MKLSTSPFKSHLGYWPPSHSHKLTTHSGNKCFLFLFRLHKIQQKKFVHVLTTVTIHSILNGNFKHILMPPKIKKNLPKLISRAGEFEQKNVCSPPIIELILIGAGWVGLVYQPRFKIGCQLGWEKHSRGRPEGRQEFVKEQKLDQAKLKHPPHSSVLP